MHALIEDPSRIPPALYRRFARRAQVRAMLPDFLVRGEPYPALNALLLSSDDFGHLRELTATFATLFQRAATRLASDVPALIGFGFPWVAAELLAAEPPRVPIVGRFDFVRDVEGRWWLLEFNADTPSGIREAIAIDRLAYELAPGADRARRANDDLAARLGRAFRDKLKDVPIGRLGLVTSANEVEDMAQIAFTRELISSPLSQDGFEVIVGDLDDLRTTARGISLLGRHVEALYRYVPFESTLGTPAFAAIYDAVARGRLRLINGLFGLLLQNKALLAWIWEPRTDEMFDWREQEIIARHLPATWSMGAYPHDVQRADLVAKQVFGREGEEVIFGEDASDQSWAGLRRRDMIAQTRVRVGEVRAVVPTVDGMISLSGFPTVGSFAVDGEWGGFYTRFGAKITTSSSKWLATWIESA